MGRILEDEEEGDQFSVKASELKVEFDDIDKMHPLILDVELPFWNNLGSPYYIRFLNANKNLGLYDTGVVEHTVSNPRSPFCRTLSLVNIPINLSSSEVFLESPRYCRRTASASHLGDFFVEFAYTVAESGDIMISPSVRYIFDSVERNVMARSLLKGSLFFQLGTLDAATSPSREEAPFRTSPMKTSEFSGAPFGVYNALSQDPDSEVSSPGSQISDLKVSEKLIVSYSSTNLTSSYKSNSSPCLASSKGLLYCVWKNGSLSILFKEEDDMGKVYVANLHKIEASVDTALDYLYIFRSMTDNKAAEFVGKMKVFSSLILNPDRSKSLETEFVLFGIEDRLKEVQDSTSSAVKNKGLSKKVSKMFKSSHSFKHKATSKIGEPTFQPETFLQDPALSKSSDFGESKLVNHLENGFRPNLELAAIIVKGQPRCREKDAEIGGWGLKFLEKVTKDHADTSVDPLLHSENCEARHLQNSGASWTSIDVLIPAGFHGGPITDDAGPSALTERWRSGGHCDCGGWDVGCPLTILSDKYSVVELSLIHI